MEAFTLVRTVIYPSIVDFSHVVMPHGTVTIPELRWGEEFCMFIMLQYMIKTCASDENSLISKFSC